jgi:hypothetical protein
VCDLAVAEAKCLCGRVVVCGSSSTVVPVGTESEHTHTHTHSICICGVVESVCSRLCVVCAGKCARGNVWRSI